MSALLVFTLFTSSCSTFFQSQYTDRSIANEVELPVTLDETMTIKSSTYTGPEMDLAKSLPEILAPKKFGIQLQIDYQVIEDPKMSNDIAFKIVPTIEKQKYVVKIFHSVSAKTDLDAITELKTLLFMDGKTNFASPYSLFELYYNAKEKDFSALQVLAKLRALTFTKVADPEFVNRNKESIDYWGQVNEEFEKQERIYTKSKKIDADERRAVMDVLDKVSEDQQFRTLIAKNDRKGAAKLLRQYLPWEEMPPFEKLFWENHLSIIENPLPLEERVLIYRGLDGDAIQAAEGAGKKLTTEEAIKKQNVFIMSSILTKNQGSWNRRLRSLTSMYDKFINNDVMNPGTGYTGSTELTKAVRITNMFAKHSIDPSGSPFLSYTPMFYIAKQFGNQRSGAYFIDPRILYYNYASKYPTEYEFLSPLMSFPDELAAVYDADIYPDIEDQAEFLKKKAIAKLEKTLGAGKGAKAFELIEENSKKYFAPLQKARGGAVQGIGPDGKLTNFFKKTLGMPAAEVSNLKTGKTNTSCTDLIQLFWK
ncbi:hypothetical protein SHI21_08895 [Bacteriovorax sp. PP10]|uniref:Lipoprotein n=1 Tax=Bacteriovorax antarcticus TaxID=3088717 RepID=A0ABU5VTD8_9BACT|nr:hypothetical protein [Bacteriovorax sp. PP10]MEA9356317.1 hypothetical protein [Bacteriovorax sp. PP10]